MLETNQLKIICTNSEQEEAEEELEVAYQGDALDIGFNITYILDALQQMQRHRIATVEVKPAVEQAYNHQLQDKLTRTIWNTGGCRSWYLDPRTGKNTTLWPGSTWRFKQITRHFALKDYVASMAPIDAAPRAMAAPHSTAEGSLS